MLLIKRENRGANLLVSSEWNELGLATSTLRTPLWSTPPLGIPRFLLKKGRNGVIFKESIEKSSKNRFLPASRSLCWILCRSWWQAAAAAALRQWRVVIVCRLHILLWREGSKGEGAREREEREGDNNNGHNNNRHNNNINNYEQNKCNNNNYNTILLDITMEQQ